MNEFTSLGREVFALFYAKATWRCLQGGKAAEQFRPFFIITTMKHFYLKTIFAWLMMTMLFPLAIHAEEGYYYIGSQNYWTPGNKTYQFTKLSDGKTWTLTMTAHSSDEFKIAPLSVESWDDWDKMLCVPEGSSGLSGNMSYGGANFSVTSSSMTSYTINIVPSEMTYEITINENTEAQGDGTLENPYNVAAAIKEAEKLQHGKGTTDYYVKGKISRIERLFENGFADADFWIADDGNQIYVSSAKYLENKSWNSHYTQINIGDEVIIYGKFLKWYSEPSEIYGGYIYSLNGVTEARFVYKDGDLFDGKSIEGVDMTFTIVSVKDSTCKLEYKGVRSAVPLDTKGKVTIPETIKGFKVIGIGLNAFGDCKAITSIDIPSSVTSIERGALANCTSLSSINIPYSVTSIATSALEGSTNLTSIIVESGNKYYDSRDNCNAIIETASNTLLKGCHTTIIPNSITCIANRALEGSTSITNISIPNSVTTIGNSAFKDCTGITEIIIPSNVATIGSGAFEGCTELTTVTLESNDFVSESKNGSWSVKSMYTIFGNQVKKYVIGNNVVAVGSYAFQNCTGMTSVIIGNSVTKIDYHAFYGCTNLTDISFPNSLTMIDGTAFEGTAWNNNLADGIVYVGNMVYKYNGTMQSGTTVVLNEGTIGIARDAFRRCQGLISIKIPSSVKSIGEGAFYGCNNLEKVIISDISSWCRIAFESSLYPSNPLSYAHHLYYDENTEITSLIVPDDVTSLGNSVFDGWSSLTNITIPNSVTTIGEYAFQGCSGLASIIIPNSITTIESYTFKGCRSLANITIPNSVTTIGKYAFEGCSGLVNIDIPNSVTTIGSSAFKSCNYLSSINFSCSLTAIDLGVFENCTSLANITIPNSVTTIGNYAFSGCTSLRNITIPDNVINIGVEAFYGCTNLLMVNLSSNLQMINQSTFKGCTSLQSITIPSKVASIEAGAFDGCALYSVTIESDAIANAYYTKDSNLKHIFGEQVKEYVFGPLITRIASKILSGCNRITNLTIGNNVASIGQSAFEDCSSLTAITIPNSVTNIGKLAFKGCSGLKSITIPNSVTSIGIEVFSGCIGLNSINIPNSVTNISRSAFSGCSCLTSITIPNSVTRIGDDAFSGCDSLTSVTLESNAIVSKEYTTDVCLKNIFGEQVKDYTLGEEVKSIGDYAFYNCSSLFKLSIPSSVISIGKYAFSGCNGLQKVVVANIAVWSQVSLENIESNPLHYAHRIYTDENTEISELIIPDDVEIIGEYVFAGCNRLSSVMIPCNVKKLAKNAFEGCDSISTVTLKSDSIVSKEYTSSFGFKDVFGKQVKKYVLGEQVTGIGNYAFYNCTELVSINIPNHVTHIGTAAFAECSGLTSVNIPNSVIDLASDAFSGCSALASVTLDNDAIVSKSFNSSSNLKNYFGPQVKEYILGENISSIGDYAFYDCNELTKINIPSNVTNIGNRTFAGCSSIVQINIPINLKAIGNDAFENCNSLAKVIVPNLAAWCGITFANNGAYDNSNPLSIAHHLYNEDGTEITDLIIPEGVETINSYAFYGGSNFTSVTIPSSLKTINDYSFYGCDNLSKVIVPDLTSWCNINFGSNYNSNPLSISGHLYSDNEHEILDLVIPYGVANINDGAFYGGKFSSLALPTSLKTIGNYAFSLCPNITSVVIPNGVTTIGMGAFGLCDKLATVVIPNSVSSIGKSAFANCLSLYSVTSLINIPFNLDESAFQYLGSGYDKNIIYMAATLYVPRGRNAMYGSVQGWKNFTNIMETDTKYSLTYMLDGEVYKNYEIQATEVITPEPDPYREGYEFSGWSAIPSVMPAHDVVVTGSFTPSTGINTTSLDESTVECYYSIDGQRINTPQRGVNIIKMKDGSTKKIMVK